MSAERVDSPHSGLSHVRKWLARTPQGATELRLVVAEGDAVHVLERWEAKKVRPALAPTVIESIDAHAVARERDIEASLVFFAGDKELVSRAVRRRFQGGDGAAHLSGSTADQARQAQAHLERMTGIFLRGMEQIFSQAAQTAQANAMLAKQAMDRMEDAREESRQLRRELAKVSRQLGEEEPEKDESEGEAMRLIKALGPLVVPPEMAGAARAMMDAVEPKKDGAS